MARVQMIVADEELEDWDAFARARGLTRTEFVRRTMRAVIAATRAKEEPPG